MARIFPFRGVRFDPDKVGNIALVVAQPYDKIDSRLQEIYYQRHPFNIVRITRGKTLPGDTSENNQYTRARDFLEQWLREDVFRQDADPALYVYDEEFKLPSGERRTRRGLIALGELEEFARGGIMPHEKTLAGPKADRLNLMRATGTNLGQIFMLYSDPGNIINNLLEPETVRPPLYDFSDDSEGEPVRHRLWAVAHPPLIEKVAAVMATKPLFIADGHHRYETALNYRNEMRAAGKKCEESRSENFNNCMMTFVNFDDPGLTILPTHRVVHSLPAVKWYEFLPRLKETFNVSAASDLPALLDQMRKSAPDHSLGFSGGGRYYLLKLPRGKKAEEIIPGPSSSAWKNLDVSILHTLILDPILGIDAAKLEAHSHVRYQREAEEAEAEVQSGKGQMAFFLNPTRPGQVKDVAGRGEKMPQKSTDFFPKILTGLVINKFAFKIKGGFGND